ncbi:MAG: PAS domain S-box protein [Acidobacteria bacterium]|nr:PAS domain S-box protein [Acidobacteriota bacterium]
MDNEGKPPKDLSSELESLREEIAHLQSLIQNPIVESAPPEAAKAIAATQAMNWQAGLLENGPFGLAIIDSQFRIESANRTFCRMLGYDEQEMLSLHIQNIAQDPDTCMRVTEQVRTGVAQSSKIEAQFIDKNREPVWIQFTASAVQKEETGASRCLIVVEDIGARKWAELEIKAEKQLLERLINSSVDGIFAFDCDGFFTVWNPGMERIFGIAAKEVLGRPAFQACPFLKDSGEDENFAAALKGQKIISKDKAYPIPGTTRQGYFEGYYGPMLNARDGEIIGGLAIIRDVTERKRAEEAREASEQRYRELFENAYDMVYTHDMEGLLTSINKAAERITGYARAEALQMNILQFVAPEFQENVKRILYRQSINEAPITQELDILARDGSRITLEVSSRLIFEQGKPMGVQGIARNITERKRTEMALQEANEKLEAWVKDLEQRTREMTLLSEMGDILRACLTTEEVYEVIVRVAQEVFPVLGGALYVIGPLRNIVEAVAEWGDTSNMELAFAPDDCWALRRGRVHCVEDTGVGLLCKHLHTPPPKGYICVPMMAQSEAVGILHLAQPEGAQIPESKQRLAMALAEHVAMALSNLRLHETLRNQSIRDQLTGLFNRSFMEESLELELRRAVRSQNPLSIIMLALDNFQDLTERHGLDAGDTILRRTAMMLQANVRKGDIACRFSGQTFILVLPNAGFDICLKRAETMLELVRTLEVKNQSELVDRISASVGLAVFPNNGQTVEAMLRSAESALNRAKVSGGNRAIGAI